MSGKVYNITLPELHEDQIRAWKFPGRFKVIRCGRRWGKTTLGTCIAASGALNKEPIGWFAPSYRLLTESYVDLLTMLQPVVSQHSKPVVLRLITGGRIDFWTLENEVAGRGRKYQKVLIDEAAFTKPNMLEIWRRAILPTLFDYGGEAIILSNTNGADPENFLWRVCNEAEHGFVEYHAPTHANPILPIRREDESVDEWQTRRKEELARIERDNHPLVYAQEYLAEFVDWAGVTFFERDKLLVKSASGKPVPMEAPERPDAVFAVIDTAAKTGKENDGTAVTFFSYSTTSHFKVVILDWDLVQIEGALLEAWLPTVFKKLEALATQHKPRMGSLGVWIEDKTVGTILIQRAQRNKWPAHEISNDLVAYGKDERCISVSGYVYQEHVKFSRHAFDKTTTFKGQTRNHLLAQILSFRIGNKDSKKQPDDLLDTFTYGISLALGNRLGF